MWYIKLQPNQKLFFTSDTHYNHKNICRGVTSWTHADSHTRDFPTLSKMNDTIVNNINNTVGQDDILVHLGDWSFGGFEFINEFRNRLICQNIYLILGNHDHHIERDKQNIQSLFVKTSHYEILRVIDEDSDDVEYDFVLSHFPIVKRNSDHIIKWKTFTDEKETCNYHLSKLFFKKGWSTYGDFK